MRRVKRGEGGEEGVRRVKRVRGGSEEGEERVR